MTIYYNVTDAVSSASNHGITRTERKLGAALARTEDVSFVVMHRGRLWRADTEAVLGRMRAGSRSTAPLVEWLGDGSAPPFEPASTLRSTARSYAVRLRQRRDHPNPLAGLDLQRIDISGDDVLVSVGLDWVHGTLGEAERLVFGHGGRFVGMCYDTIPIDHPEWVHPPDPEGFAQYLSRMSRVSDRVMCISSCTRRDYLRHVPTGDPDRAPVVRLGSDAAIEPAASELDWVDVNLGDEPYAIYCATIDRRKNHALLYRVVKEFVRRGLPGRLVFVGMVGSGVADLMDTMRHDRSIAGRVAHITQCDDAHLAALYRRAAFAVYPSLYEGWGLGVTEALAHGRPCLVASGSSLAEAGLGLCRELHPLRTGDWVAAMTSYVDDPPALPPVYLPTWSAAAADVVRCARS